MATCGLTDLQASTEEAGDLTPSDLHCAKKQRLDTAEAGRVAGEADKAGDLSPPLVSAQHGVSAGEENEAAPGPSGLRAHPQQSLPAAMFTGQQTQNTPGYCQVCIFILPWSETKHHVSNWLWSRTSFVIAGLLAKIERQHV